MREYILKIRDIEIPYYIKNYKKSKTIKIFFKEDRLTITKSPYVPKRIAENLIFKNKEKIYQTYKEIYEKKKNVKSNWQDGQIILYLGEKYNIDIIYENQKRISTNIDKENKKIIVILPFECYGYEKENVKKAIVNLYRKQTEIILKDKLDYWSKKTNIDYKEYTVRDAKTKYGSCIPSTKQLRFTSRLIMLKEEAIDAVIVHELCHIVYPNHQKEFYDLIYKFIPNYKEIDKYLKECSKYIRM